MQSFSLMERHRTLYKDLNNGLLSPSRFNRVNRNINNNNRAEKRMQNYLSCRNISLTPSPKILDIKDQLTPNCINKNEHTNSEKIKSESSAVIVGFDCLPAQNANKQTNLDLTKNSCTNIETPKSEKEEISREKEVKLQRQNAIDGELLGAKQTKQNKENQSTSSNGTKSLAVTVAGRSAEKKLSRRENYLNRYIEWKKEKKIKEEQRKNAIMKPFVPAGAYTKSIITPMESLMPKNYQFKPPTGIKSPVAPKHTINQDDRKHRQSIYKVVPTPPKKNSDLGGDHLNKKPISSLTSELLRNKLNNPQGKPNSTYSTAKINTTVNKPGVQLRKVPVTKNVTDKTVVSSVQTEIKKDVNSSLKPRALILPQPAPHRTICANKISEHNNIKQDKPKNVQSSLKAIDDNAKLNKATSSVSKLNALSAKQARETFIKPSEKVNPKPTKGALQRGALGKIKDQQSKRESNTKESHKTTYLSRNLKSKKVNKLPQMKKTIAINYLNEQESQKPDLLTPFEIGNLNPFAAFVTSTKTKSPLTNAVEDISKEVSPVKPSDNSAKRTLTYNTKKFNFLRYSIVEHQVSNVSIKNTPEKCVVKEKDKTLEPVNQFIEVGNSFKTSPDSKDRPVSYLSPFVSVSRGKVSLIKEKEKRNSIYLSTETDSVPKDNNENINEASLSIEARRILAAVIYFRNQLTNEIARLHGLCDNWEKYKSENLQQLENMGGDDMINMTIGQTRLLTSKKFMQFKGLIERCESGAIEKGAIDDGSEDTKPVTDVDLEGFWSMLGLQIDNVDKRFDNLNRWRDNNWSDPDAIIKLNEKKKKAKPKAKATTKAKPSSALQEMLRKIHSERRRNANQSKSNILQNDIELTPTRALRSHSGTPSSQGRSSSRRISILVRDRKSFSKAPTIITMTPPSRKSSIKRNASMESPKFVETINEFRRSFADIPEIYAQHSDLLKTALLGAERKRHNGLLKTATPSPVSKRLNERKSILKTPGTAKRKPKNVNFNEELCIKRFKFIIDDKVETSEEIVIQQKSDDDSIIDALNKRTAKNDNINAERDQDTAQNESSGEYKLRNRRIKLRPSSDIVIP